MHGDLMFYLVLRSGSSGRFFLFNLWITYAHSCGERNVQGVEKFRFVMEIGQIFGVLKGFCRIGFRKVLVE